MGSQMSAGQRPSSSASGASPTVQVPTSRHTVWQSALMALVNACIGQTTDEVCTSAQGKIRMRAKTQLYSGLLFGFQRLPSSVSKIVVLKHASSVTIVKVK